jgi:hypothetical protein
MGETFGANANEVSEGEPEGEPENPEPEARTR